MSIVQGGRIVLKKGYGFANIATGRRVDPDATLFRIGSITKTFTWIAVMKACVAAVGQGFARIRIHLITCRPPFD